MNKEFLTDLRSVLASSAARADVRDLTGMQVALPESVRVVDLERFCDSRRRYRGAMRTSSITDYVAYSRVAAAESKEECLCFIDADDMSATTFFNLGDQSAPGHGDYQSYLRLKETAPLLELKARHGRRLTQTELAEWIEDWAAHIEAIDEDGAIIPLGCAAAAVRRITIGAQAEQTTEESSFGARRTSMTEVEAKNRHQFPAFIDFSCEPYQGLPQRSFRARLGLITGDSPSISLRVVRMEQHQEEMAKELVEELEKGFGGSAVSCHVGSFAVGG